MIFKVLSALLILAFAMLLAFGVGIVYESLQVLESAAKRKVYKVGSRAYWITLTPIEDREEAKP